MQLQKPVLGLKLGAIKMNLRLLKLKQHYRSNDYADGAAWDGESPRNDLQAKYDLLPQL